MLRFCTTSDTTAMTDRSSPPPTVYALGSNGSGQLGLGHLEDVSEPQVCRWIGDQRPLKPKSLAAGGNHTVILDADGSAWLAGGSEALRRSICDRSDVVCAFRRVEFMHPYKFELVSCFSHVAATWESITFVGCSGEVYVHGSGSKGELGLGGQCLATDRPLQHLAFPPDHCKVVHLAGSLSHTVAVLDNGEVWGWGGGRKSQLGSPPEIRWTPRRIEDVAFKAKRAVCGREFTYVIGFDASEQLLLGPDKWSIKSNLRRELSPPAVIGASWSSIFLLMDDGKLVRWGRNDRGQLGPQDLPLLRRIAVGSEHVVALTDDGRVLAWGWGEHGNCGEPADGNGNVSGRWNELTAADRLIPLGAGCATSFLLSKSSP